MKKSDLVVGQSVVQFRNGEWALLVMNDMDCKAFATQGSTMANELTNYNEELLRNADKELDIMVVGQIDFACLLLNKKLENNFTKVWTRQETKKMTIADIQKELGYKIEVVE